MYRKILITVSLVVLLIGGWFLLNRPEDQSKSVLLQTTNTSKPVQPSATLTQYSDPSGFAFSYPDNLSIKKNDTDSSTYADLELSSSQVSGSLLLRVADSKYKTLDNWINLNKGADKDSPKDVNLGKLKGKEITTADRLYLGALDQGILFTIEMPLVEKDFWNEVYGKVTESFSFAPPAAQNKTDSSADDVSFEGEDVVQ